MSDDSTLADAANEGLAAPDDPALQVVEIAQTVLTALILAFVFRAFLIEAFMIPTGSMAPGLVGQHGAILCPSCGFQFDYGPQDRSATPDGFDAPASAFCPNCHSRITLDPQRAVKSGDRVLVHKWPYVLGIGPNRWDVIVFRDPADPSDNYIKRLVGLPGEAVEILDGDVFIRSPGETEFKIARKTPAAQRALWYPVFDQTLLPTVMASGELPTAWAGDERAWSGTTTREITCDARGAEATLRFAPVGSALYLQDVYGYNGGAGGEFIGDARVRADVCDWSGGSLTVELKRDGIVFEVTLRASGELTIARRDVDGAAALAEGRAFAGPTGGPVALEIGHLDYQVYARINGRKVAATSDADYAPNPRRLRETRRTAPIELRIRATDAAFRLRGLRVDRDVHYSYSPTRTLRAYAGHPFELGAGEYFVLGDNSPSSHDSREWRSVGPHLREAMREGEYRFGVVPEDQIVGRAFFVYLPGLAPLDEAGRWRIPDFGRMRFVR